ncbi:MAG TPA: cupin domain-containing protein [Acidimicrobiia bacterium]|jgi:quercetin dioxygenase-like cupin family protein
MSTDELGPTFFLVDELPWPDESKAATAPTALIEEAKRLGAKRKFLARGEGGFFSQYSVFPAGYTVPPHRHDHDEMIIVLEGSCTMLGGGPTLRAHDSMVLRGGYEYGFSAGDDGMTFITIRPGQASTSVA